jgi:hypothetical protein
MSIDGTPWWDPTPTSILRRRRSPTLLPPVAGQLLIIPKGFHKAQAPDTCKRDALVFVSKAPGLGTLCSYAGEH